MKMITKNDCVESLDKYSLEVPDEVLFDAYVERSNNYQLTYSNAENKALKVLVVCYLTLVSGSRELSSRGADGASQSFKNKDTAKYLRSLIKNMDKKKIINDLPNPDAKATAFFTVWGH